MDFVKADSSNLPKMNIFMIVEFMKTSDKHNIAEIRGAKSLMSSRNSYVDTCIGYVELKRENDTCIVKAKVVPEHKVGSKLYKVSVIIDELEDVIVDTKCDDCVAAHGGCKHTLVLLYWLNKRSEEPAVTSVQCYWTKPTLSSAKTDIVLATDIYPDLKKIKLAERNPNIFKKFIDECANHKVEESLIMCHQPSNNKLLTHYCVFQILLDFSINQTDHSYENFKKFTTDVLNKNIIEEIEMQTRLQSESKLWHSIRQGRVTASTIFEASRCATDGALVQRIMGGYKVPETQAITRGKNLETAVIAEVEEKIHCKIQPSGFILINAILGASPDGLCDDFIVEVKCPMTKKTTKSYITNDDTITEKYIAQIQTQMHAANKKKGLFCVADPNFERNKIVKMIWVDYNKNFVEELMKNAEKFWEKFIFPKIINTVKL